jgi:hypothetical protein
VKSCAHCQTSFQPQRMGQRVCSPICAARLVKSDKKAERVQTKSRKEAIKTIPQLIKEAQVEFNAFIRHRDRDQPCICCGQPLGADAVGGGYDCGHYRSTGSASHLRFDERNAHAQRKHCNRYGAGRAVDYRIGLIARIGLAAVEALESDNEVIRWDRDTLRQIKVIYRAKLRQLLKEQA